MPAQPIDSGIVPQAAHDTRRILSQRHPLIIFDIRPQDDGSITIRWKMNQKHAPTTKEIEKLLAKYIPKQSYTLLR